VLDTKEGMTTADACRISLKQSSEVNDRVAKIYEAFIERRGVVPNMFKVWAHAPALLETAAPFSWALLGDGALPGFYKELIATRVSLLEECEYGVRAHEKLALNKGATAEQVAAMDGPQQGPFTAREKLGFAYAERVLHGSATVDDTDFEALKEQFTEAEIVELTAVAAGLLFFTRFINTLRIPITQAATEARA
jgi:AhpD family alkylhydroperoxidase